MATNNLLAQLTYATPPGGGGGIVVTQPIPLMSWYLASSGAPLTTTLSTNPGQDKFSTNITGLSWAATKVVPAGISFTVPRDYDEAADHLKIRFGARMSGSTDTPGLDCAAYTSLDPTTDVNPTKSADLSASCSYVEIDLSGNSLIYGTSIEVGVFPEAHGTDAVQVWHSDWEYKSMIVAHDEADRA